MKWIFLLYISISGHPFIISLPGESEDKCNLNALFINEEFHPIAERLNPRIDIIASCHEDPSDFYD